ncbi:nucleoside 2-deoxyribosyltransferase domain-containing protein [Streptomyces sp. NPDC057877]|uniref:nucleoside 2-deoxyribosyltransferase domain-containing protein n=1 Tax=Streptomyces sp. NPDC057877 TaxID=3346269 RepID=UPI0036D01962
MEQPRYVEAPGEFESTGTTLFLAGGITGCPDWQRDAVRQLDELGCEATVLNPRRASFPQDDPRAHDEQVGWEYAALRRADVILFWFRPETAQPIVLYELGFHAARDGAALVVGAHPHYERRRDVLAQLARARPDITVHDSLSATVGAAVEAVARIRRATR